MTSTSTTIATSTRGVPCPTGEAGVMNVSSFSHLHFTIYNPTHTNMPYQFDDLETDGVSALPLEYQDFKFSGSAGWQYFSNVSYPANSTELRSIGSAPNAILSRSYGLVSFGSEDRGFSFDLTSVSFFAFTAKEATTANTTQTLLVEIGVTRADTSTDVYYLHTQNGALNATAAAEKVELAHIGDFEDLVDVSVAVWQSFDNSTREGNPAAFVLDDIAYVKRPECASEEEADVDAPVV